jgi:hypothetical protein
LEYSWSKDFKPLICFGAYILWLESKAACSSWLIDPKQLESLKARVGARETMRSDSPEAFEPPSFQAL